MKQEVIQQALHKDNMKKYFRLQQGQALVTLLLFVIISVTITTGAIIIIYINSQITTKVGVGNNTKAMSESGVENALLRLLRDPSYTGETITLNGGTVVVQVVNNSGVYTITSTASYKTFQSIEQATATISNNIMNVTSWRTM